MNYKMTWFACTLLCGAFSAFAGNAVLDSDGDGISDVVENRYGFDPLKHYDSWRDEDNDHLPDIIESIEGLDTSVKDNDVYADRRLRVISAVSDIIGKMPDRQRIRQLMSLADSPVALYLSLLDETHLARMGFVGRVYQAILSREPDLDGARYYHHMLGVGMTRLQMVEQFLGSKEFQKTYGKLGSESFVDVAHLNVLGYAPDRRQSEFYRDLMTQRGMSRAQLMLLFIESFEYLEQYDEQKRLEVLALLVTGSLPQSHQLERFRHWLDANPDNPDFAAVLRALLSGDAFAQARMAQAATKDTDGDGKPDGIEFVDGSDIQSKDNNVLGDDRAFVAQMLRDVRGEAYSLGEFEQHLAELKQLQSRGRWLFRLLSDNGVVDSGEVLGRLLGDRADSVKVVGARDTVGMINTVLNSEAFQSRFY